MILFALGAKKTLGHEAEHLSLTVVAALRGGIALYLAAIVAFRFRNVRSLSVPRTLGALALVGLTVAASRFAALSLFTAVCAVMWSVVAFEAIRHREARQAIRSGDRWSE